MKVKLAPTITNQKTSLFSRVKRFFVGKIKTLKKDTFEKSAETTKDKNIIVSRKYPNWCDGPETQYRNNTIAKTRCYYPEDLEKMKTMTKEEQFKYKDYLDKIRRFYYSETLTKEKHEAFMRSLGLDPNEFYIRDKK